ncbi:hypothetical protein BCB68_07150 [Leptotrichia sp. oral taxon 498]|uniref:DUF1883 domain-containing protein n=1 Tax=Leptotrichia sp. oral taxon 498 TaxID=712368 RepID=UPI000B8D69CF|nr:DUF1883 domain-containing protein [Leptotrichia sp. oral taxon 498]ASQ48721.1 hypothetical protein BCB68_07150 [Leptotrichia sp. oral taxon 498]
MKYLLFDLKHLSQGNIVEVRLIGTECDVMLVNYTNLSNYKNRRSVKYYGGHYKQSPVKIPIPHHDHWYVIVTNGNVKASVSIIKL